MTGEYRFKRILEQRTITGNPKGYFVNKHQCNAPCTFDAIRSVSFAFCDIDEVAEHFTARGSEYAICFHHDFLQSNGMQPVVYLNDNDQEQRQNLVFNAPYLIEAYAARYDMRWENEWRVKHQLTFTDIQAHPCKQTTASRLGHSYCLAPNSVFACTGCRAPI